MPIKVLYLLQKFDFMAETIPQEIKPTQTVVTEKPVREFINVNTTENSRLNKGANEKIIYETKDGIRKER